MLTRSEKDAQIAQLKTKTENEIHQAAISDPDNPPLTDSELGEFVPIRAFPGNTLLEKYKNIRERNGKQLVSIRCDVDILDYFRAKGKGYQTVMNDALRAFMEAEIQHSRQNR